MRRNLKRMLSLLLCALLLCSAAPLATAEGGIPEGYIGVYTVEDLYLIRYELDKNYILMDDIDLTEATAEGGDWDNGFGWAPIGEDGNIPFTGTFDGNGHTITGLQIRNIKTDHAGLFGYVKGSIRNLTLADVSIHADRTEAYYGALAGYVTSGAVENVAVTDLSASIQDDIEYVDAGYIGGIVGYAFNVQFADCRADGSIAASYNAEKLNVGGIVGCLNGTGSILRCANHTNITANDLRYNSVHYAYAYVYAGGVVGNCSRAIPIQQCFNTGAVFASANAFHAPDSETDTNASAYAGGICGNTSGTVLNCYNTGEIQADAATRYHSGVSGCVRTAFAGGVCGIGGAECCLNFGKVSGVMCKASAVAYGLVQNCFYLRGTAETGRYGATDTATTAVVLSEAQTKLKSLYKYLDFETVWYFDPVTGIERPQLIENPEIPMHTHVYSAAVTAPTCTENGYTIYTCSLCGERYTADETDALGHDFGAWTVTTKPTCTADGEETRACTRCDEKETRPVDALGHDYEAVVTEPTCTEKGFTTYTCSACGESFKANETVAPGHDFGAWMTTTAPTCTADGEETRTCARCGAAQTQPVDALGHNYEAVVTEPACTAGGYTTYTCAACGDSYTADETDALGHDFGAWIVTTKPTCTADGEETRACTRCDETQTQPVDALGHDFGAWIVTTEPTCTADGEETRTCARCGAAQTQPVDALGHNYEAVVTEPTCTAGGYTTYTCATCGDSFTADETDALEHDFVETVTDPTCTTAGWTTCTCARCGSSYTVNPVEALGHDFGNWEISTAPTCTTDGEETRACTRCDEKETRPVDALGHSYSAAVTSPTCTEKGYTTYTCSACGSSYKADETNALGHEFGAWTTTAAPTCTADGAQTRACTRCDETQTQPLDALGHNYEAVVTEPTCTEKGFTTYICSACGESYTAGETPVRGHSYFAAVTEPTCTEKGYTTYTCSVCGSSYKANETAATGHDFGAWMTTTAPTVYAEGVRTQTCSKCGAKNTERIAKLPTPKIAIRNFVSSRTVDYRSTITFTATVENPIPGGQIHWFIDGELVSAGEESCTVKEAKKSFDVQAKYVVDSSILSQTETEKVTVKTGFFARLAAFFRALFRTLPVISQAYLGAQFREN